MEVVNRPVVAGVALGCGKGTGAGLELPEDEARRHNAGNHDVDACREKRKSVDVLKKNKEMDGLSG